MTDELKEKLISSYGRKLLSDFLTTELKKPELIDTFDRLTEIYYQVNSVVNISALKEIDDVYIKHYLDSIVPYRHFDGTVCDVGCGGGFPSLPLAIVTDCRVTGLDSVGKKLLLIHRAVSELYLKNIKADYARSEDLVKLHRTYDTVCARALGDVDKSLTFCAPLAKVGGKIVLYRTQNDLPAKTQTVEKCNVKLLDQIDYSLPGTDINRRLLIYGR